MLPYTKKLHELVKAESKNFEMNPQLHIFGKGFFSITPSEAKIFGLDASDHNNFCEMHLAYDLVFGLCDYYTARCRDEIFYKFRGEHLWIKDAIKERRKELWKFIDFAEIFNIGITKSTAFYHKRLFWEFREDGLI